MFQQFMQKTSQNPSHLAERRDQGNQSKPLIFKKQIIRRVAREKLKAKNEFVLICMKQAWTEVLLFLTRGINFRYRQNEAARNAYAKMALTEFESINARQQWTNWRTIPQNLTGRITLRPMKAIDLCCGTGHSTEVLAHYLPSGSEILGLEFSEEFLRVARKREYIDQSGAPVRVEFNAQSVLELFCDADGNIVPDHSVDLVNSCGAVGCHFDQEKTLVLAIEVARVVKSGGLAMIDSGAPGTNRNQLVKIFESKGFQFIHSTRSCFFDRYTQVCFKKR